MDLVLPDCESPQRLMKLLRLGLRCPTPAARAKRVGQLRDREDTLALKLLTFFRRHAGEQAEIALFHRLSVTSRLELAFTAMPVQHEVWWRGGRNKFSDFLDMFAQLDSQ